MSDYFIEGWSESYGISLGGYRIYKDDVVIYETEVGNSINAVHCFLGICHILYKYSSSDLFSNNKTAISWFNKKKVNCNHDGLIERIEKAEKYLKENYPLSKCVFIKKDEYFDMVNEKKWLRKSLTINNERLKIDFDDRDGTFNEKIVNKLKELNYKSFGFLEYIKIIGYKGLINVEYKSYYDNKVKNYNDFDYDTTTNILYTIGNLEREL